MAQKQSYDFEEKTKYREILRDFIAKHYRKDKQRKGLRVACFPAHEGLEVSQVYLPLGVAPHRIWGIESNPDVSAELRSRKLGINIYEGDALDFFHGKPDGNGRALPNGEKFDVVNLDFQGQLKDAERRILESVFWEERYKPSFIFGTNLYSARDRIREDDYTQCISGFWSKGHQRVFENFSDEEIKEKGVKELALHFLPEEIKDKIEKGELADLREQGINSVMSGLVYGMRYGDIMTMAGDNFSLQCESIGLNEADVRKDPSNYSRQFTAFGHLNQEFMGKALTKIFPRADNLTLEWLKSYICHTFQESPMFVEDCFKGKYVGDGGAPMIFDLLKIQRRKAFTNPALRAFWVKEGIQVELGDINRLKSQQRRLEKLIENSDRYLLSQRKDISRNMGEEIRSDLETGVVENEIVKKYNITLRQLAGHKASLSRKNGNGGKQENGRLYKPTSEEETEILDYIESGIPDDEILETFPLTKMQLAARKAKLTRQTNGSNSLRNQRAQILERDEHRCQYRGCSVTQEENQERSGHGLHVHHIDYDHENNNPINQISLCTNHHAMTNLVQHGPQMRGVLEERITEIYVGLEGGVA